MTLFRTQVVRAALAFAVVLGVLSPLQKFSAHAQNKKNTAGDSAKLLENVRRQIVRGRAQLDGNQSASVDTLRAASQQTLNALIAYVGPGVLTAPPEDMPRNGIWADAAHQAAEAHYWWGRAADQFGMRDEAITAFARASRFAGRLRPKASDSLARDSLLALGGALRDGLPLLAPDDTLVSVAQIAHGNLWKPRRFSFSLPQTSINADAKTPGEAREFLITSGRVYPPVPSSTVDVSTTLSRVPPIYRGVDNGALPEVLRLDRMAVGYFKETSSPDKGLWRQAACVFYASPYLTRDHRDDQKRAEALCAQFLKVRALFESTLGLTNRYNPNEITNLWLSEVSALWPKDDNDPRVRNIVGILMPKINTPSDGVPLQNREIEVDPFSYPWRAGTPQTDTALGDILLFQMTQTRDDAEWLRELTHEYGHVVLPAIDGFKMPLEPFANGELGETLGLLWAASAPNVWKLPAEFGVPSDDAKFAQALSTQVSTQAMPALNAWKLRGPNSPLRRDTTKIGLQYLQGLAVYIERVYGTNVLGATFSPLFPNAAKTANAAIKPKAVTTDSIMANFPAALNFPAIDSENGASVVLPIWLPGAMDGVFVSTSDFISRANLKMKAGQKISGWLYVPARLSTLHLEWKTATIVPNSLQSDATLKARVSKPIFDANNAYDFEVKSGTGWQRFNFTVRTDLELVAAQFQR